MAKTMPKIYAEIAKYVKLGRSGRWERRCLEDGTIRFGYDHIPHELALTGDRDRLKQFFVEHGVGVGALESRVSYLVNLII